jgi:hypothetical protein
MVCHISRFYYCDPSIDIKTFLQIEHRSRNGVAYDDISTSDADAFEAKLLEEQEPYLRVDL